MLTDAASVDGRKVIGSAGLQTGMPAAGIGHQRGTASLVGLGGVFAIFQAAWKLGAWKVVYK